VVARHPRREPIDACAWAPGTRRTRYVEISTTDGRQSPQSHRSANGRSYTGWYGAYDPGTRPRFVP